jgi:hypothetical protein
MNKERLKKHIGQFLLESQNNPKQFTDDLNERTELIRYYQSFDKQKILSMNSDDLFEYIAKLWAMLIWGNKHYVVDKLIEENGFELIKRELAELVWGEKDIASRWDKFRGTIKGMGPAMLSEILCKSHPNDFMLWNRRAHVGLDYLEVPNLPRYDYQLTGKVYQYLCEVCKEISRGLRGSGFTDTSLLAVDYFIWNQLQVEDTLSDFHKKPIDKERPAPSGEANFIHDDVRDKLREIGMWLGFEAKIEQKVSEGSKVDTIWESRIGNMGRVIYIFEVQTKGSIDSLMLNLLKSLNNQAVQGVVAVSDHQQLEKIKGHASDVKELKDKLKYWNYEEILKVHEYLEYVNGSINKLGLVPEGFYK